MEFVILNQFSFINSFSMKWLGYLLIHSYVNDFVKLSKDFTKMKCNKESTLHEALQSISFWIKNIHDTII